MTGYFLGADIGGTKSHVLIADATGQVVGWGEAGPGNPESIGYAGFAATLHTATTEALQQAGLTLAQVAGAGLGVAGYDWPSQRAITMAAIHSTGLMAPAEVVNDATLGLLAGTSEGWGVAVVSGTGCNCRGWDQQRREGRVLGMGWWAGEAGGAGELVGRALQAVAYAWTRRGPSTALTAAFIQHVSAQDEADLLEGLCVQRYTIGAEAARIVFRVAEAGDAVARAAVHWAGQELGELAKAVIRQLNFEALPVEVVMVGSMYNGGELLVAPFQASVRAVAPAARFVRLTVPPVIGGVLLGMEQAELNGYPIREHLIANTQALRASPQ